MALTKKFSMENEGNIYCVAAENGSNPDVAAAQNAVADADQEVSPACNHNDGNGNNKDKEEKSSSDESDLHENLEHILPDNLFGSPRKSAGDNLTVFSRLLWRLMTIPQALLHLLLTVTP
ncbi:hypothetical protein NC652_023049 [Populus alba x Populus x berolinensis]|nr:hypothetical protein NC652_023049 [Populus alba x Populus x berolinensis]